MNYEHTKGCIAARKEYEGWNEKFHAHCDNCGGQAYFYSSGGIYEPPSSDPCPECIEAGRCPRCMSEAQVIHDDRIGDLLTCTECGFDERKIEANNMANVKDANGDWMLVPEFSCECYSTACEVCGNQLTEEELEWSRKNSVENELGGVEYVQACAVDRDEQIARLKTGVV